MTAEGILKGEGGSEGRSKQRDDWYWGNLEINLENSLKSMAAIIVMSPSTW